MGALVPAQALWFEKREVSCFQQHKGGARHVVSATKSGAHVCEPADFLRGRTQPKRQASLSQMIACTQKNMLLSYNRNTELPTFGSLGPLLPNSSLSAIILNYLGVAPSLRLQGSSRAHRRYKASKIQSQGSSRAQC